MKNLQKGLIFFGLFFLLISLNNCSIMGNIFCPECPIAHCEPDSVALDPVVDQKYKIGQLVASFPKTPSPNSSGIFTINDTSIKTLIIEKYKDSRPPIGKPPTITPEDITVTKCICDEDIFLISSDFIIGSETTYAEAANQNSGVREEGGIFSLNYLVGLDHENEGIPDRFVTKTPIPPISDHFALQQSDPLIAILDSGIDFSKFPNVAGIYAKTMQDPNVCSINDDTLGYNFIDPLNPNGDISDSNGHGTVVSLAYKAKLDKLSAMTNPKVNLWYKQRMLTVKVLDECGYGTIFSTTCGLAYARQKEAKIINCSWGLYFNDVQLQRAISQIPYETAIVCSGGNKDYIIGGPGATDVHFPSGYGFYFVDAPIPGVSSPTATLNPKSNVYEVLGIDFIMDFSCPLTGGASNNLADYSNERPGSFAEPAENVESILTGNPCPDKEINGTSFAAPCLTAGLVYQLQSTSLISRPATESSSLTVGNYNNNYCYTVPICN